MKTIEDEGILNLLRDNVLEDMETITVDEYLNRLEHNALYAQVHNVTEDFAKFRDVYSIKQSIINPIDEAITVSAYMWLGRDFSIDQIKKGFLLTAELLTMVDDKELADAYREHCCDRVLVPRKLESVCEFANLNRLLEWKAAPISEYEKQRLTQRRLKYRKLAHQRDVVTMQVFKDIMDDHYSELKCKYEELKQSKAKILEAVSHKTSNCSNKEIVDDLTEQLMQANQHIDFYKAALYDRGIVAEEDDIDTACESLILEKAVSVDLSQYKIMVVTSALHANAFKYEIVDIDKDPKRVNRLLKADAVVIDTKHISHPTYYSVRNTCQAHGIKTLHYGRRDPKILDEMLKRILNK